MEEPKQLVEHTHPGRCLNQYPEDQSIAIQTIRPGWVDQINS